MKISNSKKELARIISENGGWRDGAEFFVSTCNGIIIGSSSKPKYTSKYGWVSTGGFIDDRIELCSYLKNWHQTILSREEYFLLHQNKGIEDALDEPMVEAKPTIEQLAADYRNLKDYADRKQQEADEAKAYADARLKSLELAGEALGMLVTPITTKKEPELVITDWRDLQVGDEVEIIESMSGNRAGEIGVVSRFDSSDKGREVRVIFGENNHDYEWLIKWRFIRRP